MKNQVNLRGPSLAVTLLVFCGMASSATSQFVVPHAQSNPDAHRGVEDPSSVTVVENESLDVEVVSGATEQDAINHAQNLLEEDGGVKAIATGSGLGFVSTYTVHYSHAKNNVNLSRLQQRLAAVQADLLAKAQLIKFLNGCSIEGQEKISESIQALDSETQQDMNRTMTAEEQRKSVVAGLIRGTVTYDFRDEPEGEYGGTCTVSVVTTPRTRGQVAAGTRPNLVHASDIQMLQTLLLAELKSGLMPPNGGRTILLPGGGVAWVGFGSALVRENRDPRLRNSAVKMAKGDARLRAGSALHAVIKGEDIEHSEEMQEKFDSALNQYEVSVDLLSGEEEARTLEETEETSMASSFYKDTVSSKVKGTLPPGVITQEFRSGDGHWQYCVHIYEPAMTEAARKAAREMEENSPFKNTNNSGPQYMTKDDGSFKKDKDGRLIPKSLGRGRVTEDDDL